MRVGKITRVGDMDTGQALTRFFQRNSEQANDLTLYPHKEMEFWHWVGTWAVCARRPSDLGCSDDETTAEQTVVLPTVGQAVTA